MQIHRSAVVAVLAISLMILLCVYSLLGYIAYLYWPRDNIDTLNPVLTQLEHYKDSSAEFRAMAVKIGESTIHDLRLSHDYAVSVGAEAATVIIYVASGIAAILVIGLTAIAISLISAWKCCAINQRPAKDHKSA